MSDTKVVAKSGIGFAELLQVVFIVMKLAKIGEVANWSWWWVFAPTWIPLGLVLGIFALAGLIWLWIKVFPRC